LLEYIVVLYTMSYCLHTRFNIYKERFTKGEDTHRDDIGTLQERKNHIMSRPIAKRVQGKNFYRRTLVKLDLLMTLLEDGEITLHDYLIRQDATSSDLFDGIQSRDHIKTVQGTAENGIKRIKGNFAARDRLRDLHQKKYGHSNLW